LNDGNRHWQNLRIFGRPGRHGAPLVPASDRVDPYTGSAVRVTIKDINQELAKRGHRARLVKAPEYFYFFGGDAADWLDRTVRVPTLSGLTLAQWLAEFQRLKKLNADILRTKPKAAKPSQPGGRSDRGRSR